MHAGLGSDRLKRAGVLALVALVVVSSAAAVAQQATITRVDINGYQRSSVVCSITDPSKTVCNPVGVDGGISPIVYEGTQVTADVYYSVSGLQDGRKFSVAVDFSAPAFNSLPGGSTTLPGTDGYGESAQRGYETPVTYRSDAGAAVTGSVISIPLNSVTNFVPPIECNGNKPVVLHLPLEIDLCGADAGARCTSPTTIPSGPGSIASVDLNEITVAPSIYNAITTESASVAGDGSYDITFVVESDTQWCYGDWGCAYIPGDIASTLVSTYTTQLPDGGLINGGSGTLSNVQWAHTVDATTYPLTFGPATLDGYTAPTTLVDGVQWQTLPLLTSAQANTQVGGSTPYLTWSAGGSSVVFAAHHLVWDYDVHNELYFATFHYPATAATVSVNETTIFSADATCSTATVSAPARTTTLNLERTTLTAKKVHAVSLADAGTNGNTRSYDNPDAGALYAPGYSTAPLQAISSGLSFTPQASASVVNPIINDLLPSGVELAFYSGAYPAAYYCVAPGFLGNTSCDTASSWTVMAYTKGYIANVIEPAGTVPEIVCGASSANDANPDPGTLIQRGFQASPTQHFACLAVSYPGVWVQGALGFGLGMRLQDPNSVLAAGTKYQATNQMQIQIGNLSDAGLAAANVQAGALAMIADTFVWEDREGVQPGCTPYPPNLHAYYGYGATIPANDTTLGSFTIDVLRSNESSFLANSFFSGFTDPTVRISVPPQLRIHTVPHLVGADSNGNAIAQPCVNLGGSPNTTYDCSIDAGVHFNAPAVMDGGPSPLQVQFTVSAIAGANAQVLQIPITAWSQPYAALGLAPYYSQANPFSGATDLSPNQSGSSCPVTVSGTEQIVLQKKANVDAGTTLVSGAPYSYDVTLASGTLAQVGTEGTTIVDMFGLNPNGGALIGIDGGCSDAGLVLTGYGFIAQADGGSLQGDIYFSLDGGSALVSAADGGPWIPAAQVADLSQVKGVEVIVRSSLTGVSGELSPLDPALDLHLQMAVPPLSRAGQLCNVAGVVTNDSAGVFSTTGATAVAGKPLLALTNPCPAPASSAAIAPACSVAETASINLSLVGSDSVPGSDQFTYHCANLPSGALLNASSGQISWTPPVRAGLASPYTAHCWITDQGGLHDDDGTDQAGDHCSGDGTADVDDSSGHCGQDVVIAVVRTDLRPVFAGVADQSIGEHQSLSFQASVTDPNCDSFTFTNGYLPPGMSCTLDGGSAACGAITASCNWTPDYTQAGLWTANFTATEAAGTDGGPLASSLAVKISVSNVDRAPTLATVPDQVGIEETALQFSLDGGDPDIPLTGYHGLNGTSAYADSISYAATSALPSGATFDAGTESFNWTPALGQWGDDIVTFLVVDHDGPLDAGQSVHIHVKYLNEAPVITQDPGETGSEGALLLFNTQVSDPRGNDDQCTMTNLPVGALYDSSTRGFSWTPIAGAANGSPYTVTTTCCTVPPQAADPVPAQACASSDTQISLSRTDTAPTFAAGSTLQIPEAQNLSFVVHASDINCDTFSLAATGLPPGMSCVAPSIRPRDTSGCNTAQSLGCSWTPDYTQAGNWTMTVTAQEADGTIGGPLSSTQVVQITVSNVDRAPVLSTIADQVTIEDSALFFAVDGGDADMPLTGYAALNGVNPVSDSISFSALSLPAGAQFDAQSLSFSWSPAFGQWGEVVVPIDVVDHDGPLDAGQNVHIHVQYLNLAPDITAEPKASGREGNWVTFYTQVTDPRGNDDSCTMDHLPDGANYDPSAQKFSWKPGPGAANLSPYTVTTTCCTNPPGGADPVPAQACSSSDTEIDLTRVDTAPAFAAIGPQEIPEHQPLEVTVSASDINCDAFTLSATALPPGMLCAPSALVRQLHTDAVCAATTRSLLCTWTPDYTQAGTWTMSVAAQEAPGTLGGPLASAQTVQIVVSNVDRSPVLAVIAAQVTTEETPLSFGLDGGDVDIPLTGYNGVNGTQSVSDSINYFALNLPSGARFNASTHSFNWTPARGQWGDIDVPFEVIDHDGPLSDEQSAHIHVRYRNLAPLLSQNPVEQGTEGQAMAFATPVLDPRGNLDSCSASGLPSGAAYDPVSRRFSWSPGLGAANGGPYLVTVTCCTIPPSGADPVPAQACASSDTQIEIGTWIHLQPEGPFTVTAGTPVTFPVQASAASGGAVTCTVAPLPTGASYDAATNTFSWTPAANQTGTHSVIASCSDGEREASEPVSITVVAGTSDRVGGGLATMGCTQLPARESLAALPLLAMLALLRRRRCTTMKNGRD